VTAAPRPSEAELEAHRRMHWAEKYFVPVPPPSMLTLANTLIVGGFLLLTVGLGLFLAGVQLEKQDDTGYTPESAEATNLQFLGSLLLICGIAAVIFGIVRRYKYHDQLARSLPKPRGHELDRALADDMSGIEQKALDSFGITPEHLNITDPDLWDPVRALGGDARGRQERRRPIVLFGPVVSSGGAVGLDDGRLRFREYRVMVVCPTDHHLAIYNTVVSLLTGLLSWEDTFEYQYNHVTELTISSTPLGRPVDPKSFRVGPAMPQIAPMVSRQFRVGVSSGSTTGLTVSVSTPASPHAEEDLRNGVDDVIASIRRVLWDKGAGPLDRYS